MGEKRKTGIGVLGDIPWGSHFCLFYGEKQDLIDSLAPFFKEGLEGGEFCIWVVSEPLSVQEAEEAMKEVLPRFKRYPGKMEILQDTGWYLKDGALNAEKMLEAWVEKHNWAVAGGFKGLRAAGDGTLFKKDHWAHFCAYEHSVNRLITEHQMIAACAYRLGECGASEAIDIIQRHQWAVIVRGGKCELLKGTGENRYEELIHTCREQLGSLAAELSLAEERERRRIATELHDLIGQTLAVSRIKLGTLREMLSSARSVGILDEVREHIEETIRHTRSMVFELSPPALYMIGLGAALEQLAERIQEKHGLKVDFIDDGLPKPINDETCITLFSGVRELLTNVIKHAQASSIRISLKRKANDIVIEVKDDGIGFTIKADGSFAKGHGGFGLFSIRERLQHLGGRLEVESRPGKGTRVTLYVPVEQQ